MKHTQFENIQSDSENKFVFLIVKNGQGKKCKNLKKI